MQPYLLSNSRCKTRPIILRDPADAVVPEDKDTISCGHTALFIGNLYARKPAHVPPTTSRWMSMFNVCEARRLDSLDSETFLIIWQGDKTSLWAREGMRESVLCARAAKKEEEGRFPNRRKYSWWGINPNVEVGRTEWTFECTENTTR